ncbi:MAG: NAD(P)-binding protein, partial [Candidatus Freyarchaeota archaeon]
MADRYDAIVVGAGLGGLASAATLAKNGLSVLLLER